MRITSKGQVTIPADIREQLGLLPDTEVQFQIRHNRVLIEKAQTQRRGARMIEQMRGRATGKMSTDEIMALTRGD